MTQTDLVIWYATKFIGMPYHWTGDDPVSGFDCSGLFSELCRAFKMIGTKSRYNAAGLYSRFRHGHSTNDQNYGEKNYCNRGFGVFWESDKGIIEHVELAINDQYAIGAFGGDKDTDNLEDAIEKNAFVGVRPIHRWRTGKLHFVKIFNDDVEVVKEPLTI
jgi:hypothetical protein